MTEPTTGGEFTREEVWLALRNHGMHLEGLRYPITPVGMHYLLIHFDIPMIDPATFTLEIGGLVREPYRLTLDEIRSRPAITMPVAPTAGKWRGLQARSASSAVLAWPTAARAPSCWRMR